MNVNAPEWFVKWLVKSPMYKEARKEYCAEQAKRRAELLRQYRKDAKAGQDAIHAASSELAEAEAQLVDLRQAVIIGQQRAETARVARVECAKRQASVRAANLRQLAECQPDELTELLVAFKDAKEQSEPAFQNRQRGPGCREEFVRIAGQIEELNFVEGDLNSQVEKLRQQIADALALP